MRVFRSIIPALAGALLLCSCGLSLALKEEIHAAPDYTSLDSWASHPEFDDYSDSSLAFHNANEFGVPVFFVHPTVYFPEKGGSWNVNISNADYQDATITPINTRHLLSTLQVLYLHRITDKPHIKCITLRLTLQQCVPTVWLMKM